MAKKYRVAVIGRTGKGNYGHGLDVVWKALDNVEVVAVADENEKGRSEAAKRLEEVLKQAASAAPRFLSSAWALRGQSDSRDV